MLFTPKEKITTLNGYAVLAQGPARRGEGMIAICFRNDYSFERFVVWTVFEGESHYDCSHGEYLETLTEALEAFNLRSYGEKA